VRRPRWWRGAIIAARDDWERQVANDDDVDVAPRWRAGSRLPVPRRLGDGVVGDILVANPIDGGGDDDDDDDDAGEGGTMAEENAARTTAER